MGDNLFERFYQEIRFQRSAMYLKAYKENILSLQNITFQTHGVKLNQSECLEILLKYTELKNPSWAELSNFVTFLDNQLEVLENSVMLAQIPDLRGICAHFIVLMGYDFGSPSLNIGDDSNLFTLEDNDNNSNVNNGEMEIKIDKLELARKWESITHPYVIFNNDRQTFTFMGIYLDRKKYKFINPNTNQIMENDIQITAKLRIELLKQRVPIYDNFNDFPRTRKINQLRTVMGLDLGDLSNVDPDPTYELTIDNCLKLMAIFMRLRSNTPVIIMGETGCGKTRKIKFYSDLHVSPRIPNFRHLIHFKIHGGITYENIEKKVAEAEKLSRDNFRKMSNHWNLNNKNPADLIATAILFFDEANTTEAIGMTKSDFS